MFLTRHSRNLWCKYDVYKDVICLQNLNWRCAVCFQLLQGLDQHIYQLFVQEPSFDGFPLSAVLNEPKDAKKSNLSLSIFQRKILDWQICGCVKKCHHDRKHNTFHMPCTTVETKQEREHRHCFFFFQFANCLHLQSSCSAQAVALQKSVSSASGCFKRPAH